MSNSSPPEFRSRKTQAQVDWDMVEWDNLPVAETQRRAEIRLSQTGELTLTRRGIFPKLSPWLRENGTFDLQQWDQMSRRES